MIRKMLVFLNIYRMGSLKFLLLESSPIDAELTGPWFTPDEKTLFLAVQHPGEGMVDPANPTGTWPNRPGDNQPRPAVVAITGFKF
jgi:secreted PhoX family phosphatase